MQSNNLVDTEVKCYHCGEPCADEQYALAEKVFCCYGCKTVFEILNENDLCEYYSFDEKPGITLRHVSDESYAYLDEPSVRKKLMEFDSAGFGRVWFFVPAIHCISCIWLLENLQRLRKGILKSEVDFAGRRVRIDFNPAEITPGKLAQLLASLGYIPQINLESERKQAQAPNKSLITKLAVAGFAFGNIMMLSFPEYLGLDGTDEAMKRVFSYLNILLALPVILYSSRDYFMNAWHSFANKQINIDVPIAVGLFALFTRSAFDILLHTGPGYMDSLAGLVFFLLIGRWFQSKTYESLAFDRDYKSYFPLAVQKWIGRDWVPVVVHDLQVGDQIRVRNVEIVPADSTLLSNEAYIDYSFVTGESKPIKVKQGDLIYAGGRLIGQPVELCVTKIISQSHLTSLWNNQVFQKPEESRYKKKIDQAARVFTWVVMGIAFVTAGVWYYYDPSRLWLVLTSVLMVACPCALALAAPFTYGSMLRVFGRNGFYLKNADVIERLAGIDSIVFDKTGTITHGADQVKFTGSLDDPEMGVVKQLTSSSTHPMSNLITRSIGATGNVLVSDFREIPGKGIEGKVDERIFRIGSAAFTGFQGDAPNLASKVFVAIDGNIRGYFSLETSLRKEIKGLVARLRERCVALLSGDHATDEARMKTIFPGHVSLLFDQSPHDKLAYISNLQRSGKKLMMIGDGLNDSGALRQSDVGVAVTDDTGVFTPACDGILFGTKLGKLDQFLRLSRSATLILKIGFGISFFYNIIALSFAITGYLTPIVAAILMPISSISVVGFSTLAVNLAARSLRTVPAMAEKHS
jgi:P-type Cu+ transporter